LEILEKSENLEVGGERRSFIFELNFQRFPLENERGN